MSQPFRRDVEAKTVAAKAALPAAAIRQGKNDLSIDALRYDPSRMERIRKAQLKGPLSSLERLKAINPEAYHYWTVVQEILG